MNSLTAYINASLQELRHVRWPTRHQAVRFSAVVLVFTAVCAAIFGAIDFALTEALEYLLSLA